MAVEIKPIYVNIPEVIREDVAVESSGPISLVWDCRDRFVLGVLFRRACNDGHV
jgi:hypothetical protein